MVVPERVQFRPLALWTARSYRGLTISELARRADVSRQVVSGLENGSTPAAPTTPAVRAVAFVLDFPTEFFFTEQTVPQEGALHFRRRSDVPERAISKARAQAALFAKVTESFRLFAQFRVKLPSAAPLNDEAIEDAAEAFRRAVDLDCNSPIVSAVRAAEAAGVFVGTFDGESVRIDGFAHSGHVSQIMLNRTSPWSRRRFSVMHELGHLVLHGGAPAGDRAQEKQADRFAGAVLCPRAPFWREFPRPLRKEFNWASIIAMKKRWGMSIQALLHRAYDLRIIDPAQYKRAFIHVTKFGWRTREPAEDEPELPRLCARFVEALDQRGDLPLLLNATALPQDMVDDLLGGVEWQERSQVIPMRPRAPRPADVAAESNEVDP